MPPISRLLFNAESADWLTRCASDELLDDEPGWQLDSDCDMLAGDVPVALVLCEALGRESPIVPTFCAGV